MADVLSTPTYDTVREAEAAERLEQVLADPETRQLFEGLTEAEQLAVLSDLNRAQQEGDPPSADAVRDALTKSDAAATLTPEQREMLADQIEGLLEAGAGQEGVLAAIEQSAAVAHMSVDQKAALAMDVLDGAAQPASADTSGVAAPVENLLGGGTAIERAQPPEYWDQVKADYLKSPNAPEDATEWRQEAEAAVARAVQEFREQGYSPGALAAAERTLRESVGSGQSEQEQSNIARMKDLTRGQVWTDTGEGYEQTDPDADVQIGIDAQGNVVGSTTSRPVPDTEWDRFLASEEARLVAENAARRAGDPNNPIDQRAAAFRELKDVAGAEGFSSAEFEAFASTGRLPDRLRPATVSGGGNQAAGTEQLLSAGPDLPAPADGQGAARVEREFTPEFVEYAEKYGLTPEQLLVGMADEEASGDFDGVPVAYAEETLAVADRTGETPSEVVARQEQERAAALEAVAFAQSDRMGYLESKGYDSDTVEGMTQDEIDNLVDVNVSSDRQAVARAQSDVMGYLEAKGYDADTIEGMSQDEMLRLADVNVASDQREIERAQSQAASGVVALPGIDDESAITGADQVAGILHSDEYREAAVENILDQIAGRMDSKDIGMLGTGYGLEGVQDYVSGAPVRRLDGETDPQYEARIKERNNPTSQDSPWWGGLWGASQGATTVGYTIDPKDPRNASLVQQQAEGAKDWFRPQTQSDGTRETAQEWANRVVNQGDMEPEAVALLGGYLYPEGTNTGMTVADAKETPGFGYGVNSRQTYDAPLDLGRELTWSELAKREAGERKFGEGVITGAEIAATLAGTAGAFRLPMVARSVAGTSSRLGSGAARGFNVLGRVKGFGALRSPGAQNFAAKGTDTVVQGVAEAGIDVALGAAAPLEPMQALTPERIAQLTAFEVGAEAATNLARFGSGRFGLSGLGDVAKVGFEDIPLTGWGSRTGVQRTAYIEGAIERNPSLAENFYVVRDDNGRAVMVQPTTDVGRGLAAESRAFTRIRDGMASGMTDEGLVRIATREGLANPDEFVSTVKNVADTGQSGLFQLGGRPNLTFGDSGQSPLVATPEGIPTVYQSDVTHSAAAYDPDLLDPGVPIAYTPPGREVPSGVAVQHSPDLAGAEIGAQAGTADPTAQVTFAPARAEGITNAPPTTLTSFVTGEPTPAIVTPVTTTVPTGVPPVVRFRLPPAVDRWTRRPVPPTVPPPCRRPCRRRPAAVPPCAADRAADRPADRGTHTADCAANWW